MSGIFWGILFCLAIAAIIVAIVVLAVNNDDSDDSNNDNGGHNDMPVCKDITNTWKGRELNHVRIHIRGHHDQVLSPSAVSLFFQQLMSNVLLVACLYLLANPSATITNPQNIILAETSIPIINKTVRRSSSGTMSFLALSVMFLIF